MRRSLLGLAGLLLVFAALLARRLPAPASAIAPAFEATPPVNAYLPIILRPAPVVTGSVVLNGGLCCVGGVIGGVAHITAAFTASSAITDVTQMRVLTTGYYAPDCLAESALAQTAWEPFTTGRTFTTTIFSGWTSFDVHAQYRDALGNLSPVVCDDIAVEGMPPTPPGPF